jgi:manganese transport protein
MIPLLMMTRRRDLMGTHVNRPLTTVLAALTTAVVLALNGWLLFSVVSGKA